ncbi:MAG: hypothetical protein OHK0029_19730 [Armatimonadaceae bacterium]
MEARHTMNNSSDGDELNSATVEELAEQQQVTLFAALGHLTRLRIVKLLIRDGEKTVTEIADALHLLQSGASQHLAILSRAGILVVEQRGVARYYRVRGPRIRAMLELADEFSRVHGLYPVERNK